MRESLLVKRTLDKSCPTCDHNLIANCGYVHTNDSFEDANFSDIHLHAEQFCKPRSTQEQVFENSKWKTYDDYKYLETTHFEGFQIQPEKFLFRVGIG